MNLSTTSNRVLITNLVGILVLALGMFGIDVDDETQKQIIGGISAIILTVNMALVKFRSTKVLVEDEIEASAKVTAAGRQRGFTNPTHLVGLFALLIIVGTAVLALSGCDTLQTRSENVVTASSATIEKLVAEVELAHQLRQISTERAHQLLDQLQLANDSLRRAYAVKQAGGDGSALLEAVSAELTRIRIDLIKETQQ